MNEEKIIKYKKIEVYIFKIGSSFIVMNQDYLNDEYNEESKMLIMAKNVALMLSRRKVYMHLSVQDITDQFLKNINGAYTYFVKDDYKIELYITFYKITKIDKTEEENYFSDNENTYKILIAQMASPKMVKMFDNAKNSELVFTKEVMSDRADHVSNPMILLLTDEQQLQVIKEYNIELGHLPEIKYGTDPMARYYQLQRNEIIEINSPSEAGYSIRYRVCK